MLLQAYRVIVGQREPCQHVLAGFPVRLAAFGPGQATPGVQQDQSLALRPPRRIPVRRLRRHRPVPLAQDVLVLTGHGVPQPPDVRHPNPPADEGRRHGVLGEAEPQRHPPRGPEPPAV
ncbi:hypothetical protein THAOC_24236 [Thalassiosira oceanica]|uniref:Uncharacterized protein n=1 Tax=Thalassiosira oceanica TaxID=159749 RepID=K0RQ98_THAOC|nr:hypothetical protein THAOC_24236 [Thalassiosira oceanica]|eukprot:EJK55963.1 hypothetical protein THAOC_24236 [Thalassiosira oceanica]